MIGGVFDYCINGDENGLNQSLTGERRLRLIWKCLNDHVPTPHDIPFWQQVYLHESAIFQVTHGKIFCAWTLQRWFGSPWYVPIRAADFASSRFLRTASLSTCLALSAEFVLKRWPNQILGRWNYCFHGSCPIASTHSHINAPQYDF